MGNYKQVGDEVGKAVMAKLEEMIEKNLGYKIFFTRFENNVRDNFGWF